LVKGRRWKAVDLNDPKARFYKVVGKIGGAGEVIGNASQP
jgi:hypothetical protein